MDGEEVQVSYWFISFIAFWTLDQIDMCCLFLMNQWIPWWCYCRPALIPVTEPVTPCPQPFSCRVQCANYSLHPSPEGCPPLPAWAPPQEAQEVMDPSWSRSVPWLIISWCGGTQGPFLRVRQGLLRAHPRAPCRPRHSLDHRPNVCDYFFPALSISLICYGFLLRTLLQNTRYTNSAFQGPVLESDYKTICVEWTMSSTVSWCLLITELVPFMDDHLRKAKWEM